MTTSANATCVRGNEHRIWPPTRADDRRRGGAILLPIVRLFITKAEPNHGDATPQEDLPVVEALVEYHADRMDVQPARASRAWMLASEIAASHGLEIEDALSQRDSV